MLTVDPKDLTNFVTEEFFSKWFWSVFLGSFSLVLCLIGGIPLFLMKGGMTRKSGEKSTFNPLAEAEVYLAYGRKNQALAILEEALQKDPSRTDISEKLRALKKQ